VNLRTGDRPLQLDEPGHDESLSVDTHPPRGQTHPFSFDAAVDALQSAVVAPCGPELEWPARIAAGIRAALAFAAANPDAARALTVDSRLDESGEADDYLRMIRHFAALLGENAPPAERLPASSDKAVVSAIATIVSYHVRAGTVDRLSHGDTDMIFLVLLPYVGFHEASRWSASPN
jgi:hypothetical protein